MRRFVAIQLLLLLFVLGGGACLAQDKKKTKPVTDYIPTENVDRRKEANNLKNRPKRKTIEYIYKNNSKGILYGNPCAIEATRKMGFEYVVNPMGVPGSILPDDQFSNNLWVNIKLIFTRSPFWKIILDRKIKKCREKSGDIVG